MFGIVSFKSFVSFVFLQKHETALRQASRDGYEWVVKSLLAGSADTNLSDKVPVISQVLTSSLMHLCVPTIKRHLSCKQYESTSQDKV